MEINLVSIITPVFNSERYIQRCVNSILSQTYTNWELLLVDDCGSDNAFTIAQNEYSQDSRIRFICSKENVGPYMARKKGIDASKGEYLFFLDSDDFVPENAIKVLLENIKEYESDISSGVIRRVDINENEFARLNQTLIYGNDKLSVLRSLVDEDITHNLAGKLIRSKLFSDLEIENNRGFINGEDGFLFYLLVDRMNRMSVCDEISYNYVSNSSSTTHIINDNIIDGFVLLQEKRLQLFQKYNVDYEKGFFRVLLEHVADYCHRGYSHNVITSKLDNIGIHISFDPQFLLRYLTVKRAVAVFMKTIIIHS